MPHLDHAAPILAKRSNTVRLVQVQVCMILLLQTHNLRQIDKRAFHAVHALDTDDDLLPGCMCAWLAFNNVLAQLRLQVLRV